MAMEPHGKIINAVARKTLAPLGFFRKGSSRVWLKDNGYYFTQVDFQPSAYDKGTYLNVGMSFLWGLPLEEQYAINLDYGKRVGLFVPYAGDDEGFTRQVEELAQAALREIQLYEGCTDLTFARNEICGKAGDGWLEYHWAMLCFLTADVEAGLQHLAQYTQPRQNWDYYWQSGLWKICEQEIPERCVSPEAARQMVNEKIQTNRAQLLTKAAFKGMNKNICLEEV